MKNRVLILGASGGFGGNCAKAFADAGWEVRKYKRGQQDMREAAKGVDVIVNGLNPPNYKGWVTELPKIARQVSAAAKASGASIIQPGNVYNFGDQPGEWDEHTPHSATTKKGKARIEMERILRDASEKDDVQVIILRAGDFINTKSGSGSSFFEFLSKPLAKGKFTYPGRADAAHAWAFLPDLARAAVGLAEMRAQLGGFEDVPFQGHNFTGEELRKALSAHTGREIRLAGFPWMTMKLLSPFWGLAREMQEMRYLWNVPHSVSGARLKQLLPDFKVTKVEEMLRQAV